MKALVHAADKAKRNLVIAAVHSAIMRQMGPGWVERVELSMHDPRNGPRCTMAVIGEINMDQLADDVLKDLDA